jgi:rubrerythrin
MKNTFYTCLSGADRSIAHMAAIARNDTFDGGAKALVYAARLERMRSQINYDEVVSSVYSASTGNWSTEYEAWECPECGNAHLGQERAAECCRLMEE